MWDQGRCERRSEVIVKFHFFLMGGGGRVRGGVESRGGGLGSGWEVRVDVNREVKFL